MGLAFRPGMHEGGDRDPDDSRVRAERGRGIDVAFLALALFFAGVIIFVLLFG